jgi:hypothetical protein
MDLRTFFQKIRQIETAIPDDFVIIISLETADGGKPGLMTEVARNRAARMIVEGRARLASPEEATQFRRESKEAQDAFHLAQRAQNVRVVVVSDEEPHDLKKSRRS